MRPRTKFQKKVVSQDRVLPPVPAKVIKWAIDKEAWHYGYRYPGSKKITCMDCGHQWEDARTDLKHITCPHCGRRLDIQETRCRKLEQQRYFTYITTWKGMQIVRGLKLSTEHRKGEEARWYTSEICRYYIQADGQYCVIGLRRNTGIYVDSFSYGAGFELHDDCEAYRYVINSDYYPEVKVIPELKRNGFDGNFYEGPVEYFIALLKDHRIETLLKRGNIEHLRFFLAYRFQLDRHWESYKIAMRQNYRLFGKLGLWCDYLQMLEEEGKDTRNPHYICPPDLKEAHDAIVRKREARRKKEMEQEEMETVRKAEKPYKRSKGKYFGLHFTDGLIQVQVLDSVEKIRDEGYAMHHCVFAAAYYNRPESLILSATIDGKRIETVEFDLKRNKVAQSRGVCNKDTKYHERIVQLVNDHAKDIMIRKKQKKAI